MSDKDWVRFSEILDKKERPYTLAANVNLRHLFIKYLVVGGVTAIVLNKLWGVLV